MSHRAQAGCAQAQGALVASSTPSRHRPVAGGAGVVVVAGTQRAPNSSGTSQSGSKPGGHCAVHVSLSSRVKFWQISHTGAAPSTAMKQRRQSGPHWHGVVPSASRPCVHVPTIGGSGVQVRPTACAPVVA